MLLLPGCVSTDAAAVHSRLSNESEKVIQDWQAGEFEKVEWRFNDFFLLDCKANHERAKKLWKQWVSEPAAAFKHVLSRSMTPSEFEDWVIMLANDETAARSQFKGKTAVVSVLKGGKDHVVLIWMSQGEAAELITTHFSINSHQIPAVQKLLPGKVQE